MSDAKKLLLLGYTGKMGIVLKKVFDADYDVIGKNSCDFDASDFEGVCRLIDDITPDIVINSVAFLGIDPCENEPEKAFRLNTLYPKLLAELSIKKRFLLVHFSTDAVFNDEKKDYYVESDIPCPLNIYGLTKYGGDCFIQAIAKQYYIIRISVLFGESIKATQFVEKMLNKIQQGAASLKISNDIILSPTYSKDAAVEVKRIIERSLPFGLYHIANEGKASLYDLMNDIVNGLKMDTRIERASYKDFPYVGIKNTFTPIRSEKINLMRPWKDAVREYCDEIKMKVKRR